MMATLDVGPRADAAYHPPVNQSSLAPVHLDESSCGEADSKSSLNRIFAQRKHAELNRQPAELCRNAPTTGSTTSTGSTVSGDNPFSGMTTAPVTSDAPMVLYLREPPLSLDLSKFVDTLLDPPRMD